MRPVITLLLVVSMLGLVGCGKSGGMPEGLMSLEGEPVVAALTQNLGVTTDQAIGGVGSMMALAKNKLSADQFKSLASSIPNTSKYMSTLDGLGLKAGDLKSSSDLTKAFTKLGMNTEQASKFVPTVADVAGKTGGDSVKSLITGLGM